MNISKSKIPLLKTYFKIALIGLFMFFWYFPAEAQLEKEAIVNDLIHTKLDVRFDYQKRYLYGKEWVTLKPHFYPTDSVRLDAKGMDINNVALIKDGKKNPLKFRYDSLTLIIQLDKIYLQTDKYTLYIDYTAKPEKLKVRKEDQGLHFINPDGSEKGKPIQIWTQGETECSSAWFPTIDKPNQKTIQEIAMTVPAKFVTLSNGKLISKKSNQDGTRTDTWKMDLPHSPYLFMMAVGDFKIYTDKWHGKELNYYVEPEYAPYAKDIFGITPEVMSFFSKIVGVEYPWNKYAQIAVRDYGGGAMENTTATLFGDNIQATKRELADRFHEDGGIVHELFHQWFGNYVSAENWGNLTLNESFANLAEILWREYKFGKDERDEHINDGMQSYLNDEESQTKNLVRYDYQNREDMFDVVSYQKGGRILNMLRNYLGNEAFYKGLHIYLTANAFKAAEAHHLRLAFEEASGLDLNWFFNQWYFGAGHPVLSINYQWDEATKTVTVYMQQIQKGQVFILPIAIDIYTEGKIERKNIWLKTKSDTLQFHVNVKPDLVNVDAEKIILSKKSDAKTLDEYAFQYFNAPLYLDRYEAIEAAEKNQMEKQGQKILIAALKDKYYGLQLKAINAINISNNNLRLLALPILINLAENDSNNLVRAESLKMLGKLKDSAYMPLFKRSINSYSYLVAGASLNAIALLDSVSALAFAKNYEKDSRGALAQSIINIYTTSGGNNEWPYVYKQYIDKPTFTIAFAEFAGRVENPKYAQQGIEAIKNLIVKYRILSIASKVIERLNEIKAQRIILNDKASVQAVDDAIIQIKETK